MERGCLPNGAMILAAVVLTFCPGLSSGVEAAELVPISALEWNEPGEEFGGISAIVVASDGASFYAAGDRGMLYRATIQRDDTGRMTAVKTDWSDRLLGSRGRPVEGFTSDAEAMAQGADGRLIVAFESYTRIASYDPPDMTPTPMSAWDRFRDLWGNQGFESLLVLPSGGVMVISEVSKEGVFPTFTGQNGQWQSGPSLPALDDFSISDATIGADGLVYLLERRVNLLGAFQTRVRRLALPGHDGVWGGSEQLLLTRPGQMDNMEGISLWRDAAGHVVATLISDNNFSVFQKTTVAEFLLQE